MKYGYARVSTRKQYVKGNSIEAQKEELIAAGAEIVIEDDFSGRADVRPRFDELCEMLQAGDTLIVTKLDRFARSYWNGADVVDNLLNRGVTVNILNIGEMNNTPTGRLIRHIFLAFAEFERDLIIERTQEGIAKARENNPNFRVGRKRKLNNQQIEHCLELLETHTYKEVEQLMNVSCSTLHRYRRKYSQH